MRRFVFIAIICALIGGLWSVNIAEWQNIRFSGKTAASQALMRTEIAQTGLNINKVIYNPGSGVTEYDLNVYDAVTNTYQASIPIGTTRRYIGLKKQVGTDYNQTVPVFHEGTGLPALNQLTKASDDAQNDISTNTYDIVADYATFTDTKFITAIQNRGGGFPTSLSFGTVYPSYMSVIADPTTDPTDPDAIVWALTYMNVAVGGITPGLYKITGTSTSDLVRIGNIETQIVAGSNLLIMSCNIADLLADADFAAWYNTAHPVFGLKTIINKTTVIPFATTLQDESPGSQVYPQKVYADPFPNSTPLMSGEAFTSNGTDVYFSASYLDTEGNFPLTAQIELQGGGYHNLLPQSFDYTGSVLHRTANLVGVLNEVDNGLARVVVSDDDISFYRGEWFPYSYILSILSPENVFTEYIDGEVALSWEPVTLTQLGNPVMPDHYRIEASFSPDFTEFEVVGITSQNSYTLPENLTESRQFYRVIAVD